MLIVLFTASQRKQCYENSVKMLPCSEPLVSRQLANAFMGLQQVDVGDGLVFTDEKV